MRIEKLRVKKIKKHINKKKNSELLIKLLKLRR